MSLIAYVRRIIDGSEGANYLAIQGGSSGGDPSRPINPSNLTLVEDVNAVSGSLDNNVITAQRIEVFHVETENRVDSLDLADIVAGNISSDTDRFFPSRPGTSTTSATQTGLSGGTLIDLDSAQDVFYKPESDKVAILSVIRDPEANETSNLKSFDVVFQTNRFLLQSAQEVRAERAQIMETFGGPQLFLYGSGAEIYQYSGILLNTASFPWKAEFIRAYETWLKGSKAREQNLRVFLAYDDVLREGYILNAGINYSVGTLRYVIFNFSMFITNKRLFSLSPRAAGSRETYWVAKGNQAQNTEAEENNEQNALGIPLLFDTSLDSETVDLLRGKINKAYTKLEKEPPYWIAKVTGPRKTKTVTV